MANEVYVEVGNMSSKKTEADPKFEKSMPAVMNNAVTQVLKRTSWATTKKPSDKDAAGFGLSGTLTSLAKGKKGKDEILSCVVSMVLIELPSRKMLTARLEGKAHVPIGPNEKKLKADADACVAAATEAATKTALDHIKSASK